MKVVYCLAVTILVTMTLSMNPNRETI
jgi:hypothetical protein